MAVEDLLAKDGEGAAAGVAADGTDLQEVGLQVDGDLVVLQGQELLEGRQAARAGLQGLEVLVVAGGEALLVHMPVVGGQVQEGFAGERGGGGIGAVAGAAEAAALPLTAITAWEALFDRLDGTAAGGCPPLRGRRIGVPAPSPLRQKANGTHFVRPATISSNAPAFSAVTKSSRKHSTKASGPFHSSV